MKNTIINRRATKRVADALGDLNDKVVFVGGAMISLYLMTQQLKMCGLQKISILLLRL